MALLKRKPEQSPGNGQRDEVFEYIFEIHANVTQLEAALKEDPGSFAAALHKKLRYKVTEFTCKRAKE